MGRLTTEYCGAYVPREMCSIDRAGGVDDCDMCCEYCEATEEGHDGCDDCAIYKCFNKLGEYEDLEERGHLLRPPCAVGDTIYVIPSEVNYKLNVLNGRKENNRVYEQVVDRIEISATGYLLSTCNGMMSVIEESYKVTWFLAKKEAEATLKKLERLRKNE